MLPVLVVWNIFFLGGSYVFWSIFFKRGSKKRLKLASTYNKKRLFLSASFNSTNESPLLLQIYLCIPALALMKFVLCVPPDPRVTKTYQCCPLFSPLGRAADMQDHGSLDITASLMGRQSRVKSAGADMRGTQEPMAPKNKSMQPALALRWARAGLLLNSSLQTD